jgi:von Willebrand factor A domain-containing protein 8
MLRPRTIVGRCSLVNLRRIHDTKYSLISSEEMRGHLRWIEQKYLLGQDMILLGLPTSLKRRLIVQLAKKNGWEVEYLAITRDTTESDLKQRREIVGNTVVYSDQPPVRAALQGKILILDGIENAERNVLPTLNNLLENREMSLDDGRFLTKPPQTPQELLGDTTNSLVFVHDKFRVVALGLPVPPFSGRSLDPPLRSRFQCRFVDEPSSETLLALADTSGVNPDKIQRLINFYEVRTPSRPSSISIPSHVILEHCHLEVSHSASFSNE